MGVHSIELPGHSAPPSTNDTTTAPVFVLSTSVSVGLRLCFPCSLTCITPFLHLTGTSERDYFTITSRLQGSAAAAEHATSALRTADDRGVRSRLQKGIRVTSRSDADSIMSYDGICAPSRYRFKHRILRRSQTIHGGCAKEVQHGPGTSKFLKGLLPPDPDDLQ